MRSPRCDRRRPCELADDIVEPAAGGVDGRAHLRDLEVVLHQSHLAENLGEQRILVVLRPDLEAESVIGGVGGERPLG